MPGFDVYERPTGKSGGHGIGWSEIPQYQFRVPETWGEVPVSIADLGGTEIDLRFKNKDEGELSVVVAPVLRFRCFRLHCRCCTSQAMQQNTAIKDDDIVATCKTSTNSFIDATAEVNRGILLQGCRIQCECDNGVLGPARQNHCWIWTRAVWGTTE